MARPSYADLVARIAALEAEVAAARTAPKARMSLADVRGEHVAPCGRGFTTDATRDGHVAYWADRGEPCTAKSTGRGHGARK